MHGLVPIVDGVAREQIEEQQHGHDRVIEVPLARSGARASDLRPTTGVSEGAAAT